MQVGVLSFHGWNQQHFNSAGKRVANIGDSIREVVMMNIIKECGVKEDDLVILSQDEIGKYDGPDLRLIFDDMINDDDMIDNLARNNKIHPIFVSCFFYDDIFVDRPDRVEFFKRNSPIGCRDEHSRDLCRKNGIDAFLVGCFTVCVSPKEEPIGEKIYIVDASNSLKRIIPRNILEKAEMTSHAIEVKQYPITQDENKRLFKMAEWYLDEYRKNAKLIISGRLHATIPAFAMGIPAIIVNENFNYKFGWVDKWLKLYDESMYDQIDFNPTINEDIAKELDEVRKLIKENIAYVLENGRNDIKLLSEIDHIYSMRQKTNLNSYFKKIILKDMHKFNKDDVFNYAIWGAGLNGGYVYQIMKELFPYANLTVIVDKYKSGKKYGVPIISSGQLSEYNIQHVVISSSPAVSEAIECLEKIFKDKEKHYTIAVTQQTC